MQATLPADEFLTVAEVAERCGVRLWTARKWSDRGRVTTVKARGHVLISWRSVQEFLRKSANKCYLSTSMRSALARIDADLTDVCLTEPAFA